MGNYPIYPRINGNRIYIPESMTEEEMQSCMKNGISVCCGTCSHYKDDRDVGRGSGFVHWDRDTSGYKGTAYCEKDYTNTPWADCCLQYEMNEKQKKRLEKRIKQNMEREDESFIC